MAVMLPRLLGAVVGLAVAISAPISANASTWFGLGGGVLFTIDPLTAGSVLIGNTGFAPEGIAVAPPAVPLPAALPLFATALAGMGLLGWRRKRKASV